MVTSDESSVELSRRPGVTEELIGGRGHRISASKIPNDDRRGLDLEAGTLVMDQSAESTFVAAGVVKGDHRGARPMLGCDDDTQEDSFNARIRQDAVMGNDEAACLSSMIRNAWEDQGRV